MIALARSEKNAQYFTLILVSNFADGCRLFARFRYPKMWRKQWRRLSSQNLSKCLLSMREVSDTTRFYMTWNLSKCLSPMREVRDTTKYCMTYKPCLFSANSIISECGGNNCNASCFSLWNRGIPTRMLSMTINGKANILTCYQGTNTIKIQTV